MNEAALADERRYWLALHRAPGVGPRTFYKLLERFAHAANLFHASPAALDAASITPALRVYLRNPDWQGVERDLRWLERPGHGLLLRADPRYPLPLAAIPDAPPVLFVSGNPMALEGRLLAVVGSRRPTQNGVDVAYTFSRSLAAAGIAIASGLARGIDAAAHRGALDAGGVTVAVAGTGLDICYPKTHAELAAAILERGALVSEFPIGTPPSAHNFPRRNRVISALCYGTLVVEAALRSGSLITARHAAEQGREVFAVPGSIHNPLAHGCHALIREGAMLVESASDILGELGPNAGACTAVPADVTTAEALALTPDYQRLLDVIGFDPVPLDTIVHRAGLTAKEVSSMLLILELEGYVNSQAGGTYVRQGTR